SKSVRELLAHGERCRRNGQDRQARCPPCRPESDNHDSLLAPLPRSTSPEGNPAMIRTGPWHRGSPGHPCNTEYPIGQPHSPGSMIANVLHALRSLQRQLPHRSSRHHLRLRVPQPRCRPAVQCHQALSHTPEDIVRRLLIERFVDPSTRIRKRSACVNSIHRYYDLRTAAKGRRNVWTFHARNHAPELWNGT